jgi:hypothetical protein
MNRIDTQGRWQGLRHQLQARREARLRRLTLERELALYQSPQDLQDLYAILDRHDDNETVEIRKILSRKRAA